VKDKKKNGYELPKRVGVIYSEVKREYFPTKELYITEKDAKKNAKLVAGYIEKMDIKTFLYPGDSSLFRRIKKDKPNMVINLVDSVYGYESLCGAIPGVLEVIDVPYTGADMIGLNLGASKFIIKKILQQNGIPVPNNQLIKTPNDYLDPNLRYPLISKLDETHGSVEIDETAVSETEKQLRERLKYLISTYNQSVIVEEFIVGKEVAGMLLEGLNKKVYLGEDVFTKPNDKYIFKTYEDQWVTQGFETFHYQKYEDPILKEYVKKAFDVVRMYDYGKFDIRIDQSGRYFFIDSNCNPFFGPKETDSDITVILDMYGVNFVEILKRLMINTIRDWKGKTRLPYPENGD